MDCCQAINRGHMEDGGGGEKLHITCTQTGPFQMARISQLRQICILMFIYVYVCKSIFGRNALCAREYSSLHVFVHSAVLSELHCSMCRKCSACICWQHLWLHFHLKGHSNNCTCEAKFTPHWGDIVKKIVWKKFGPKTFSRNCLTNCRNMKDVSVYYVGNERHYAVALWEM